MKPYLTLISFIFFSIFNNESDSAVLPVGVGGNQGCGLYGGFGYSRCRPGLGIYVGRFSRYNGGGGGYRRNVWVGKPISLPRGSGGRYGYSGGQGGRFGGGHFGIGHVGSGHGIGGGHSSGGHSGGGGHGKG